MVVDEIEKQIDVRVIDQRIGMGIGGLNTVIRVWHIPSGIIVEIPNSAARNSYYTRQIAVEMIMAALTHPKYEVN